MRSRTRSTPAAPTRQSAEVLGRVKTPLATARRCAVLTRPPRFLRTAFIGAARDLERKETRMSERSLTPSLTVTIGHHTRLYFAFVTTAPPNLDTPATITLLADTLLELAWYAADPFSLDATRGHHAARLVLVDDLQRHWQCAKYRGSRHLLV